MKEQRRRHFFLSILTARLWRAVDAVSLRLKIMGMVVATTLLVGIFTTSQVYRVMSKDMAENLADKSRSVAGELASRVDTYLLVNDIYGLTQLLKDTVGNRRDIRYAFVTDRRGSEVLAHSFGPGFPMALLLVKPEADKTTLVRLRTNEGVVWDTAAPIMNGDLGFVRVGVEGRRAVRAINSLIRFLVLSTIVVIIIGIGLSGLLTWFLTRPILSLLEATRSIKAGDFSVRLRSAPHDEVGELITSFNEMAGQLAQTDLLRREKEQIRREFLQKIINTQEGERKRIALELHDQTGQSLAALMIGLKLLEKTSNEEELREGINRLRDTITKEMESIHRMAIDLRPSVLDDMGIIAALELYIESFRERCRTTVDFHVLGFENRRLDPFMETCIYRITQEALTNVARHAAATRVSIILEWREEEIRGIIEDDGVGFDLRNRPCERLGIYGMEERVSLLNGTLQVESSPGQGTLLAFTIPVSRPPGE
ncbi:MAG TPA: HAMP domain-containing protein [Desulfobulbus sp.]|nr:HAMP domain-containing protein [Desulfobulbus sp.]